MLPKGYVHKRGALPLPCSILFERDVAVPLRDGTTIYVDIFRPAEGTALPAVVAWGPYGKANSIIGLDDVPFRAGIPRRALSGLQTWEGPDPAYWCKHGYAVINADSRGTFSSEGDIHFWGTQEGRDGHDLIEWIARQPWSNGRVGLTGNSWLAIVQWFIAAEQPAHLAAIAPWEGLSDGYREDVCRGGIVDFGFSERITSDLRGKGRVEDVPAMAQAYALMNAYWEDKSAKLEQIRIPAYVVASWTSPIHTHGTLEGYRRISSPEKWLRVHNTHEWYDYYTDEYGDDLRRFFDRYLKGVDNGWERTPRVRLSILDLGGTDTVDAPAANYPLEGTRHTKLYIDADSGALTEEPLRRESAVRYRADDGKGQAAFIKTLPDDIELIGHMKLRLWVEADGADDMDLFVTVQKLSRKGKLLVRAAFPLPRPVISVLEFVWRKARSKLGSSLFWDGPTGRLRVSHRTLDEGRSTAPEPYHSHGREELLRPGQIVPVEIGLWPAGMRWRAGEKLRVVVTGRHEVLLPGLTPPRLRNRGEHVIHTGGKYDSHLLVPVAPVRAALE